MTISVREASARDPRVTPLLTASYALMQAMFGPEDNLSLDIDGLCAPDITVFVADRGGASLGCIALKRTSGYGEIKSFFVTPQVRGSGAGRMLLAHLEATARNRGLTLLRLETGVGLDAAQTLYRTAGFRERGAFGDYVATDASLFFEKRL